MTDTAQSADYAALAPEIILQALEHVGLEPDGRLLALNSYENRVYQVGVGEREFVIAKFYRPGRWSDACIQEEHDFAFELTEQEIPVVAPLRFAHESLLHYAGFRLAIYPRQGGRWPELENRDNLEQLGRFIGRIHAVGRGGRFVHRPRLNVQSWGRKALAFLQDSSLLPGELRHNFVGAAEQLLDKIELQFEAIMPETLRLHGDCHPGNILWTGQGPHFVDLDDCCTGPQMQDLWMLLSGTQDDMAQQLLAILQGYETFTRFDYAQIQLIEPLRGLRLIHYCAWLARRWDDPAFPHHFPWFNTPLYWEDQINTLREQIERCDLPVIRLH